MRSLFVSDRASMSERRVTRNGRMMTLFHADGGKCLLARIQGGRLEWGSLLHYSARQSGEFFEPYWRSEHD